MAGIRLFEFAAFIAVVISGGGIILASLSYLFAGVMGYFLLAWVVTRDVDWMKPKFKFRVEVIKKLARPAVAALGFPLGFMMNVQGVRLVLGAILGPGALTVFVAMRTLSVVGMRIADTLSLVMEPEYGYAWTH